MGLDFVGYKLHKGETLEDIWAMPYEEQEKREVFYGRKAWELVYALRCDTRDDCCSKLEREDWIKLVEQLHQVGPFLNDIHDAYYIYNKYIDEYETTADFRKDYPKEMSLIDMYEKWFDENFDIYPQLGYEFSVGYMKTFWDAVDKVLEYLDNPDYEVWMVASY